jgi:hypothetical protein
MGDRKYRQRGYMDSRREERPEQKRATPPGERLGPRTPAMPRKRSLARCSGCGVILPVGVEYSGKCPQCGVELHCCKQCANFDTSSRFECTQPITARIPRKDSRNECNFFMPRVTVERETSSSRPADARAAFESLFRK